MKERRINTPGSGTVTSFPGRFREGKTIPGDPEVQSRNLL